MLGPCGAARQIFSISLLALVTILPSNAQSNRALLLAGDGTWHLHSRVPLGTDTLILQPSHRKIQMMASAESPAFAGWTLQVQNKTPVLLDRSGQRVKALPQSITFRITVSTRDRLETAEAMPVSCTQSVDDFLLNMRFTAQVFRGMEMHTVNPTRQWMIGVPADESADERIYRASFDLGEVRPDDRIVLLVTDASGARLSKFHLEFL